MNGILRKLELNTRDKNQINAAFDAKDNLHEKVIAACEKVLTRHGVEGFHGPYSQTVNHGESTVTLEYFIG